LASAIAVSRRNTAAGQIAPTVLIQCACASFRRCGSRRDRRTGLDPRRSMSAYRPTNDNWSSRFTALAPVQFESLWESGVTTSLRGGAGTAHRSGVASAWGKSLGRTPGGAWRELGEELEKSSGRNVAKARGGARSKAGSNDSRGSGKKSSFRLVGAPDWKPREGRGDKTPRGTRRELGEKSLSGPSSCEKK
jgi:hypothetical protein